ncbi:lactosylceramide 1,3-N-acetyl-beta-D-glucosaminyltransferase A-like [Oratosquilla oratoria]|uniref:lactosylceramide 1,3-N-acetyl-beta-D-glucosaminyltransferase A-like n=1 Tax=Oratosquilla oratoria TaxID=337810 RepID=UPI003F75E017
MPHSTYSTVVTAANPVLPRRIEDVPFGQPPSIPTKFLIEEADFCTEERNPHLRMIGVVISRISGTRKRSSTRRTWASSKVSRKYGIRMAVVFIVGRAKNKKEKRILKKESLRYHDMVQGDFEDVYDLLTYKTLAALVWVHRHCSHVRWTFKADDDVLLNDFLFDEKINNIETLGIGDKFYGTVQEKAEVFREGKWAVPPEEFREDCYPPYSRGCLWFIPTALVPRLLATAQVTNFTRNEDVYVTGLVAMKAGIGHTSLRYKRGGEDVGGINTDDFDSVLVWESVDDTRRYYWRKLVQFYLDKKRKERKN